MNTISKIFIKLNIVVILAIVSILTYKFYLSDNISTAGSDYSDLLKQKNAIVKENEYLQSYYFELTSLSEISKRAEEQGYIIATIDYIQPDELAYR